MKNSVSTHIPLSQKMHFRSIFTFLSILFFTQLSFSQALSPQAKVSLVTVGPGVELYSGFGHSILWIQDPATGLDRAYNYGTFDGYASNFYVKFLRGTLPYTVSVSPFYVQERFYREQENRSLSEQVLRLSYAQKQKLFAFLENNALPENKRYQYKFFYDNCSTRMTVALKAAMGDSLIYEGYTAKKLSFRQWIDLYAYKQNPWADFGMDLAIGSPSDEIATAEQATFLPDNLEVAFENAKVKTPNGVMPLVESTRDIFKAEPILHDPLVTPKTLFWILAALTLALTYWQSKKGIVNFMFDKVLFTIVGLVGWLILLLWFGTNHGVTAGNWDILWAFPLWVPIIFTLHKTKKPSWFHYFLIFYGFLLLCGTGNLTKHNLVVIPILIMLAARVYYINNSLSKIPE